MITKRDHIGHHPKDGSIVTEQVLSQRNEFDSFSFNKKTFNVFEEPGLVPARYMVDLGFLVALEVQIVPVKVIHISRFSLLLY